MPWRLNIVEFISIYIFKKFIYKKKHINLQKKSKILIKKNLEEKFLNFLHQDLTDHIPSNFALLLYSHVMSHYLAA